MASLIEIIERLASRERALTARYDVPGLWIDGQSVAAQAVNPYQFYRARLTEITATPPSPVIGGAPGGDWSANAIIYNLFPRTTAAFDHTADGALTLGANPDGWRETGTLLKCIALLPFIKAMGFNTVHLLPITAVGQDGKKGNLGSPYGIRNPYRLDENLDEPVLGLSAEDLFGGFVEAAHHLGLRVIMEFVLRTASKDGDWIAEYPEWFYWIREDVPDRAPGSHDAKAYGNPIFPPDTLSQVKAKVGANDLRDLPPPPEAYRAMFTQPPSRDAIHLEGGRYIGTLDDGTRVRIPGAFSDWPPDDNQPPWSDVTYLRMYTHPDFNYIGYNTIRMYDERSAQPQYRNEPLWEAIVGVIPHHQRTFGIDGVMIDMGHALPHALKARVIEATRAINPDFAFWDENFMIGQRSRDEGYNAVMGYWLFDVNQPGKVYDTIKSMAYHPFPIRFFAAPENHNTPRAAARHGGTTYARYALALCALIPGMPFMLSGFELGETQPINTGLGFSNEMLARYPAESLPLFSAFAFDWTRADNLIDTVRAILALRVRYHDLLNDTSPASFAIGYAENPSILVFTRRRGAQCISVIANVDMDAHQAGRAVLDARSESGVGIYGVTGTVPLNSERGVSVSLAPGQVIVIEWPDTA